PRIIVDKDTHQDFNSHPSPFALGNGLDADLRHADDGPVYVDVFSCFKLPGRSPYERIEIIRERCRDNIQAKLDASIYVPAHYKKLRWLSLVWNTTVESESERREWIVFPA